MSDDKNPISTVPLIPDSRIGDARIAAGDFRDGVYYGAAIRPEDLFAYLESRFGVTVRFGSLPNSSDDSDWHTEQLDSDTHYQFRVGAGGWSDSLPIGKDGEDGEGAYTLHIDGDQLVLTTVGATFPDDAEYVVEYSEDGVYWFNEDDQYVLDRIYETPNAFFTNLDSDEVGVSTDGDNVWLAFGSDDQDFIEQFDVGDRVRVEQSDTVYVTGVAQTADNDSDDQYRDFDFYRDQQEQSNRGSFSDGTMVEVIITPAIAPERTYSRYRVSLSGIDATAQNMQIQYSADGNASWGTTFTEGTHKYIRFSVDGGVTWSDGRKFVGDDGDDGEDGEDGTDGTNAPQMQIQFSPDGSTSWGSFEFGDKYIRFSVDGGTTWSTGIKFVGDDGDDGQDGEDGTGDGTQGAQGQFNFYIYKNIEASDPNPTTPTGGTLNLDTLIQSGGPASDGWITDPTTPTSTQRTWRSYIHIDPDHDTGTIDCTGRWNHPIPISAIDGDDGQDGGDGDDGDNAPQVQIQYSADGNDPWGTTFTEGTHKYIRFSVDGGTTWSDARKFVGDDGDDGDDGRDGSDGSNAPQVQIQFSPDGSTSWGSFEAGDEYIRFSVDGGTTWTAGIKFVGDDGDDGDDGTDGTDGTNAPQVQIQFSPDGTSSWGTFTSGDEYIRFSVDGGTTWTTGVKFVGDDGTDGSDGSNAPNVQIQFSADGTSSWGTFETGDKYIRFSVDGGTTWTAGIKFVGDDGEDGTGGGGSGSGNRRGDLLATTANLATSETDGDEYDAAWTLESGVHAGLNVNGSQFWHDNEFIRDNQDVQGFILVSEVDGDERGEVLVQFGPSALELSGTYEWEQYFYLGFSDSDADTAFRDVKVRYHVRQITAPVVGLKLFSTGRTLEADSKVKIYEWKVGGGQGDDANVTKYLYRNVTGTPATPTGGTFAPNGKSFSDLPSDWEESISAPSNNERTWMTLTEVDPNSDADSIDVTWSTPIPISARGQVSTSPSAKRGDLLATSSALPTTAINASVPISSISWTLESGVHSGLTVGSYRLYHNNAYVQADDDLNGFLFVAEVDGTERGQALVLFGPNGLMSATSSESLTYLSFTDDADLASPHDLEISYIALTGTGRATEYQLQLESNGRAFPANSTVKVYALLNGNSRDDLPTPAVADDGKILIANNDETASWQDNPSALPDIESGDDGKVLTADETADEAQWQDAPTGIPDIASGDDGKVLTANETDDEAGWQESRADIPKPEVADDGKLLKANNDETASWADNNDDNIRTDVPTPIGETEGHALVSQGTDPGSYVDILANANAQLMWEAGTGWNNRQDGNSSMAGVVITLADGQRFQDYGLLLFIPDADNSATQAPQAMPILIPTSVFQAVSEAAATTGSPPESGHVVFFTHVAWMTLEYVSDTTFRFRSSGSSGIGMRKLYGLQSAPTS